MKRNDCFLTHHHPSSSSLPLRFFRHLFISTSLHLSRARTALDGLIVGGVAAVGGMFQRNDLDGQRV